MILIVGMPGAGKSEQSVLIQERLGLHWLSTGNLFRETDDPEINEIMESGALVEDKHVFKLVEHKLRNVGYDETFLLDGFPRTVDQAHWLLDHADDINKHIRFILFLGVDDEVAMERLGGRGRDDDTAEALEIRKQEARKIEPTIEFLKGQGIEIVNIDANDTIEGVFTQIKDAITARVEPGGDED